MSNHPNTKSFYFQDIGKIVVFCFQGNSGKYRKYLVQIKTPQTINQPIAPAILGDFLDSPEVDNNYPHNVGYFKDSTGKDLAFKPTYLALCKICSAEEFFGLLSSLDI